MSYLVHNEHYLSEYKFINHKYMKPCHCVAVRHHLVTMGGVTQFNSYLTFGPIEDHKPANI